MSAATTQANNLPPSIIPLPPAGQAPAAGNNVGAISAAFYEIFQILNKLTSQQTVLENQTTLMQGASTKVQAQYAVNEGHAQASGYYFQMGGSLGGLAGDAISGAYGAYKNLNSNLDDLNKDLGSMQKIQGYFKPANEPEIEMQEMGRGLDDPAIEARINEWKTGNFTQQTAVNWEAAGYTSQEELDENAVKAINNTATGRDIQKELNSRIDAQHNAINSAQGAVSSNERTGTLIGDSFKSVANSVASAGQAHTTTAAASAKATETMAGYWGNAASSSFNIVSQANANATAAMTAVLQALSAAASAA